MECDPENDVSSEQVERTAQIQDKKSRVLSHGEGSCSGKLFDSDEVIDSCNSEEDSEEDELSEEDGDNKNTSYLPYRDKDDHKKASHQFKVHKKANVSVMYNL